MTRKSDIQKIHDEWMRRIAEKKVMGEGMLSISFQRDGFKIKVINIEDIDLVNKGVVDLLTTL